LQEKGVVIPEEVTKKNESRDRKSNINQMSTFSSSLMKKSSYSRDTSQISTPSVIQSSPPPQRYLEESNSISNSNTLFNLSNDISLNMGQMQMQEEKQKKEKVVEKRREREQKKEEERNDEQQRSEERNIMRESLMKQSMSDTSIGGIINVKVNETGGNKETTLIALQKADGSWNLDDVRDILGLNEDISGVGNYGENITMWVTAVVICYFEKNFAGTRDLWQMVVKKAVIFVKRACKGGNFNYDTVIADANRLV